MSDEENEEHEIGQPAVGALSRREHVGLVVPGAGLIIVDLGSEKGEHLKSPCYSMWLILQAGV